MTRRLLGYVVKLPDGRRLPETTSPTIVAEADRLGRRWAPAGSYVCPVFAVPKKPKPAPEVSDKEGRYACLLRPTKDEPDQAFVAVDFGLVREVGTHDEAARTVGFADDAGQGEHNVLALIDMYQAWAAEGLNRATAAEARIAALREGIRKAMSTCARQDTGHVDCWQDGRQALLADDAAKGAG